MAILAAVYHLTHYKYDRPVVLGPQVIRLQPAPHSRTKVLSHSLKVAPTNHFVNLQQDPYGNFLARFVFPEPVTELKIEVDLVADMTVYNPFDFFVEPSAETWPFDYPGGHPRRPRHLPRRRSRPGRCCRPSSPASTARRPTRSTSSSTSTRACSARSATSSAWRPACRRRRRRWPPRKGSCRDSSWLLVQALRNLGLAARFVSGYLIQLKPDLVALDGPPGTVGRLHRPACLVRGLSARRRLDRPRPDLRPAHRREPCAAGRDAAFPQRRADLRHGELRQCRLRLRHARRPRRRASAHHQAVLRRILGTRSTRWATRSTRCCNDEDVRLTMGGEPTFVSIDDFESERMEHRRRRPDQAREGRRADPPAARALRAGRLPALRPGQVVSGRNAAALDLLALLARRRRAGLERSRR